jgi:hypothetical protein
VACDLRVRAYRSRLSQLDAHPAQGVQVAGGFHVINDAPGSCTVVHYEQYHLPSASRSIAFAWRLYVTRSMNAELERIALLAQPAPGQLSDAA